EELEAFRREVRAWVEANCPKSMRKPPPPDEDVWGGRGMVIQQPDAKVWFERMVAKGWTAPTWPREYGGGGLSEEEGAIVEAEQRALHCRIALKSFGIWMLGPVLLKYATPEQKAE